MASFPLQLLGAASCQEDVSISFTTYLSSSHTTPALIHTEGRNTLLLSLSPPSDGPVAAGAPAGGHPGPSGVSPMSSEPLLPSSTTGSSGFILFLAFVVPLPWNQLLTSRRGLRVF